MTAGSGRAHVAIPIYKTEFAVLERFAVDYSLSLLGQYPISFVAPDSLDTAYYQERYPNVSFARFADSYFASVEDYSRLMLERSFYERFAESEFVLILQPDAIVFKNELDYWLRQSYDYIGAPWPDGFEFLVKVDRFAGNLARRIKVFVGNGGFSLRRINKCLRLIDEFPQAAETFKRAGSNEDFFFAMLGSLSTDFVLPNEIVASRFAMELKPDYYHAVNGNHFPMGMHAWQCFGWFWGPFMPQLAALFVPKSPA